MRKVLSILLSAMLILSTITVLMLLPAVATTATEPVNLIVNGDASMGSWSEQGYETVLDTTDDNYGFIVAANNYGWRSVGVGGDGPYSNAQGWWFNTSVVYKDVFTGHASDYPSFRANKWNQTMQDIKIEADKTYKVSADITFMPVESTTNYTGWFDMSISNYAGAFIDGTTTKWSAVTGKSYDLCDANDDVYKSLYVDTSVEGFPTVTGTNGKTYWNFGDFKTYSFTFDSNDVITDYALAADSDDKYAVTLAFANSSGLVLAIDNVSVYEVVTVTAGEGGAVNTDAAYAGAVNTLVATPYYGNSFAGWYAGDELVSTDATYTGVVNEALVAKFNVYNLIVNGDMEIVEAHEDAVAVYNNAAVKYGTVNGTSVAASTAGISNTDAATYGNYVMQVTPSSNTTNAAKQKGLINFPVTIEKNTDYIWRFSYKYTDNKTVTFNGSNHCLQFSLDGLTSDGKLSWNSNADTVKWSYHSQQSGKALASNVWSWGGGTSFTTSGVSNNGTMTNGIWNDIYVLFNAGTDSDIFKDENSNFGTIYLSLGTPNATVDALYIDNMSVTKAVANDMTTVTAGDNGTVAADRLRTGEDYYVYTMYARGNASVFSDRDVSNVYYPTMYETFTATPDEGYAFDKWVDEDGNTVSTNATEAFLMNGKAYTAVFAEGVAASEGGFLADNGDGTVTATAYYGNTFDGWYKDDQKLTGGEFDTATVTKENSYGVVAKFVVNNIVDNGNFDYDVDPLYYTSKGSGELKTEENGNRYMQITTQGNDFTAVRIPFTLEQGKKYVISFKWRESVDENGVSLSTAGTSFRKNLRYINDSNGSPWERVYFTESKIWTSGTYQNVHEGAEYNALGNGTYLNYENPGQGIDCWQRYSHDAKDWIVQSILVDTTSVYYGSSTITTLLENEGDTVNMGIMFGNNSSTNKQVIDIDDIVVGEYVDTNWCENVSGGHTYIENPLLVNGMSTTYTAVPNTASGYEFDGWYENDVLVSEENPYVVSDGGHVLKSSFSIPRVDVNEEGAGDFEGDFDPVYVADKNSSTVLEKAEYTEEQKALAGYDYATMGSTALKVTSASNGGHVDVSFPVQVTAGGKYLGHVKFLVESSTANDPENDNAALDDSSRFDIQFNDTAGSWSFLAETKGTLSISNALGNAVTMPANDSLYVSHWFGKTNEDRYNNDFVDAYYYIDASNLESGTYYMSLGMRNGGVFYVDNVTFVEVETMAPTMIGATMNTNVADGDEIMYVTRVDIPSYVGISSVTTYMAPTTKLANDFPTRVSNFADDLGEEYVATATLKAYKANGMIIHDDLAFTNGDLYSAFVGASKVTQTNKYSARSVITLTDASGNELGIELATSNTASEEKIENGVYTRSIAQVKRLNAKYAIENGYADLAAQRITDVAEGKALYNGAIAQVWEFAKEAAALMAAAAN